MIEVRRHEHVDGSDGPFCVSECDSCVGIPELVLNIGNLETGYLCETCAMKVFNALGFMLMGLTGKTLQQLVGLKSSPLPTSTRTPGPGVRRGDRR